MEHHDANQPGNREAFQGATCMELRTVRAGFILSSNF
jgi:hypothetical protein